MVGLKKLAAQKVYSSAFCGGGRTITYDPKGLTNVSLSAATVREFAVGERVQATSAFKEKAISNRDAGTILKLSDSKATIEWDSGKQTTVELARFAHFDYAYVMTSHSSQSVTVNQGDHKRRVR
jgi:ATP-dependent exoDNAse (exonuclease V) alpha subunit